MYYSDVAYNHAWFKRAKLPPPPPPPKHLCLDLSFLIAYSQVCYYIDVVI